MHSPPHIWHELTFERSSTGLINTREINLTISSRWSQIYDSPRRKSGKCKLNFSLPAAWFFPASSLNGHFQSSVPRAGPSEKGTYNILSGCACVCGGHSVCRCVLASFSSLSRIFLFGSALWYLGSFLLSGPIVRYSLAEGGNGFWSSLLSNNDKIPSFSRSCAFWCVFFHSCSAGERQVWSKQ